MNWEATTAIIGLIGVIAVFATLMYLALQVGQNTKAMQSAALYSSVESAQSIRELLINNAELTEIYILGTKQPKDLTVSQVIRYRLLMTNMMWALWNIFSQAQYARLSSVWKSQESLVARLINNAGGQWYWREFQSEFDAAFVAEINRILTT